MTNIPPQLLAMLTLTLLYAAPCRAADVMRPIESEVIAAFLNSELGADAKVKKLVVRDFTATISDMDLSDDNPAQELKKGFPNASDAVIADFLLANKSSAELRLSEKLLKPYVRLELVDKARIDTIFEAKPFDKNWTRFYKEFPTSNGVMQFSRVGYDATRKQALLYMQNGCGSRCGAGVLVLMQSRLGIWRRIKGVNVWVS